MKKLYKSLIVFILGVVCGYYLCNNDITRLFDTSYKAFQVGVYTSFDAANTYKVKYNNAIVVKDNELYRVYVSILKNKDNIESMSDYLRNNNIEYYIRDIKIDNKNLKHIISEYENIMDKDNEVVFLEINKMIMDECEEAI